MAPKKFTAESAEGTEETGSHGGTEKRRRAEGDWTPMLGSAVVAPVGRPFGRPMDRTTPRSQADFRRVMACDRGVVLSIPRGARSPALRASLRLRCSV